MDYIRVERSGLWEMISGMFSFSDRGKKQAKDYYEGVADGNLELTIKEKLHTLEKKRDERRAGEVFEGDEFYHARAEAEMVLSTFLARNLKREHKKWLPKYKSLKDYD
ncbi:hypothetical protein CMI46_00315 [Candidatus Pacearchaeota archaeon]|nr:hypothetical protein [Candidatus Pacearchaeota archaeon]|tara:strand:+ start:367 stop:690 length:324 start_codon:yes stop_codon:yes gene_type:complete